MNVAPQAAESAENHDDPGRADLAQKDPLVQPNNARPRNTLQQRPSTGHTSGEGVNPRDPPATGKGGSATPGPVIPPDPPLQRNGSTRGRAKGPAIHAGPTAKPMTAGVLSSAAIHQIRALALGERRQSAIRTETRAQAAHTALVHEIFSTLRSALVRRMRNPQDPEPHPATGPAAAAHSHTRATRVPRRPCAREETTRRLRGRLLPPGGRLMDVTPTNAHSVINHDDPGRANPAQKDPLYNPTAHGRATHTSNTCRSDTRTGTTSTCPTRATDTPRESGLALAARGVGHERKPYDFLLHPPGGGHASRTPATRLQQRKGRHHARTRPSTSPPSPAGRIHKGPGKGPGQTRRTHGRADDHENVNEQSSRVLQSKASIQGYVHRGDRRAPPPGRLHAWDAGVVTAHITQANGTRDTLPAES